MASWLLKMVNKKSFILGIILLACILLINIVFISSQASYCCEKIKDGGPWCMNAPGEECDTSLRAVPTSCEATSYCRSGTCINTEDGVCMENTPEIVCGEYGGLWKEGEPDEIPQCQLGCCLIGEQAAFVTQTRCKKLSSLYGLETNYRTDIQSEIQCIASASSKVKGACVFEKEYERTCLLLTKKECQEMGAEFHEGYLCSAEELGTNCGKSKKTTCVEGRDEVYFLDTCGNLANVYDANKINNTEYWTKIMAPTCGSDSNAGSTTCGNCDYFLGSTCKAAKRGENPKYGNYICKDLGCEDKDFKDEYGRDPEHGETWCAEAEGVSEIIVQDGEIQEKAFKPDEENVPGSKYFRLVCYDGDVTIEPCADFRQEICIESEVGGFKTAACRVNMWQDCYSQDNVKDCENTDKRDCQVIEGFSILKDENGESLFEDEEEEIIEGGASCVPKYAPGFDFWEAGGDAESMCSLASTQCTVEYEKGIFGKDRSIVPNEECMKECVKEECHIAVHIWREIRLREEGWGDCEKDCRDKCKPACVTGEKIKDWEVDATSWGEEMNEMCISLGDCGSKTNYLKFDGYYEPDDLITETKGEEEE